MDIANITNAKDELAKGVRAFKAFEKALEVITTLEGLAQFEKETTIRVDKLKSEEITLTKICQEKNAEAAQIISDAQAKAGILKAKGQELLDSASAKVEQAVQVALGEAKAELVTLTKNIAEKKAVLVALGKSIEDKEKQAEIIAVKLQSLQTQKDEVLSKFRSIIS